MERARECGAMQERVFRRFLRTIPRSYDNIEAMLHHITVKPTEAGDRFVVIEVTPDAPDSEPERDYGRLDAAVAKAWTYARRKHVPLMINIDPGRPRAAEQPPSTEEQTHD